MSHTTCTSQLLGCTITRTILHPKINRIVSSKFVLQPHMW